MTPDDSNVTDAVQGTWWIAGSTLPMWRTRLAPSVSYLRLPSGDVLDVVEYRGRRGPVRIVGIDRPQSDGSFVWRGITPLTRLATSRWRVVEATPEWAITRFARTIFTPAGWDVYVRRPNADLAAAEARLRALGGAEGYVRTRLDR